MTTNDKFHRGQDLRSLMTAFININSLDLSKYVGSGITISMSDSNRELALFTLEIHSTDDISNIKDLLRLMENNIKSSLADRKLSLKDDIENIDNILSGGK